VWRTTGVAAAVSAAVSVVLTGVFFLVSEAAPHALVLPAAAAAIAAVVVLSASFTAQSMRQLRMRYISLLPTTLPDLRFRL